MFSVKIQHEPFSVVREQSLFNEQNKNSGATVIFQGNVRGSDYEIPLSHLYIEHYPDLTESEIDRIIGLACERWDLDYVKVIHRVGKLEVGEEIVFVMTASKHRNEAYAANEFIMDYLKTEAPFWKKEIFTDNREHWVEAKHKDSETKNRWKI